MVIVRALFGHRSELYLTLEVWGVSILYVMFFYFSHAAFRGFISYRWQIHLKCFQLQNHVCSKDIVVHGHRFVCVYDSDRSWDFHGTSGINVLVWLFLIDLWARAHILWGPFFFRGDGVKWLTLLSSWWFQPIWKRKVKLDHFPK